nr:molybdopterin-dependent oxidoreductase [Alkalisalibacterium limincola]
MPHDHLDTSPSPGDRVETTTCYMCACRCGIKVWLRDGRLRYIQGNPDHPVNRGVLCAKGSAGIMQHYSPARLSKPLLRVGERGSGEFREIEWDEALALATKWLGDVRERDPNELAFFTGRDQSQALTGWWAQQFGTVNYAAHGGFCSVNMAAGGLYTLGGSFWEFGEPDWDHSRYLVLWGVAEDHDSNPIKLGLGKLKGRGAKVVAINPVRSGYGAIADEWIGIRPGSDGLLAFALIHELLHADRIDLDYLVRFTNAHWLVLRNPGGADDGLFARDEQGRALCWDRERATALPAEGTGLSPTVVGEVTLPDGRRAVPAFQLVAERYLDPRYSPDAVAKRCGVDADTIRRLAREIAAAAFDSDLRLPIAWTDAHGQRHEEMIGRPVSFHAMRGISAHSNGFHTCRALHLLQLLLGAVDAPGSFRFQPPFPRPVPPANRPGRTRREDGTLDAAPLGFVHGPEDLLVDADGQPQRIDHAYSWAYPLAAHGMMHTLIRNAWAGDPYKIDTVLMFMANMSWNSAMNTRQTMQWLTDRDEAGEYRIPHIIYSDAYASEMVAYADLVLPDTTYLERHDCISLLDRPISDADGAADGIRHPVLDTRADDPERDVRPFQSVLIELGARLGLPGLVNADGSPRYADFADYIQRHERAPRRRPAGRLARQRQRTRQGRAQPGAAGALHRQRQFLAPGGPGGRALFQDGQPQLPGLVGRHGLHRQGRTDRAAALFGDLAEVPAGRTGAWRAPAPRRAPRARGHLLRSAADLVRTLRGRAIGRQRRQPSVPAVGGHPAADVHVPLLGLAERLAAADRHEEHAVRAPRHRCAVRRGRWRHGRHPQPPGHDDGAGEDQRQRAPGHGVDLERDRQASRRVAARPRRPRGSRGLPAQPPDLRRDAGWPLRQRRPRDRAGGVVRPAHRAVAGHPRCRTLSDVCPAAGGPDRRPVGQRPDRRPMTSARTHWTPPDGL